MAEDYLLMKEMPTDDASPDLFDEPNCRVAQPAIAENDGILANSKPCDFLANDESIPTKPTEKDGTLPQPTNLPDHLHELWKKSRENLKEEEKKILLQFLSKNQDVFANSTDDLGRTSLAKHPIEVGCTKQSHIKQKPGRLVIRQREDVP